MSDDVSADGFGPLPAGPADIPVFRRIADHIAAEVAAGRFRAGDRLPTHRSLAGQLGVAVPTVSRAYREAEQRGLVTSTVGRGTFIAGLPTLRNGEDDRRIDLSVNQPARGPHEAMLRAALTSTAYDASLAGLLSYGSDIGSRPDRLAAAEWLGLSGVEVDPDRVVLCHGGQHAILVALGALLRPGQTLLTESLTYPGMKAAAQLLGIEVVGLALDEFGIIPAALESVCRSGRRPAALYCAPTAHNPTAITWPAQRRADIVDLARHFDLPIIEDDVFGLLAADQAPVPLAALAPERTVHLTSLSKTLTPGLRWGAIAAPEDRIDQLGAVVRASTFNPAPLIIRIARQWISDGTAAALVDWQRRELANRIAGVGPLLDGCSAIESHRFAGLHVWLDLRPPWTPPAVIQLAESLDITIGATSYFHADRASADRSGARGLRLCLGNASDSPALVDAVTRLTDALG